MWLDSGFGKGVDFNGLLLELRRSLGTNRLSVKRAVVDDYVMSY
jgi:hypothetical protein